MALPGASRPHPGPSVAAPGPALAPPSRPGPGPTLRPACPRAPARPAAAPGRPTHSAAAKRPRACDLGGVREEKEGAGVGGGVNPLPRSRRAPRGRLRVTSGGAWSGSRHRPAPSRGRRSQGEGQSWAAFLSGVAPVSPGLTPRRGRARQGPEAKCLPLPTCSAGPTAPDVQRGRLARNASAPSAQRPTRPRAARPRVHGAAACAAHVGPAASAVALPAPEWFRPRGPRSAVRGGRRSGRAACRAHAAGPSCPAPWLLPCGALDAWARNGAHGAGGQHRPPCRARDPAAGLRPEKDWARPRFLPAWVPAPPREAVPG